MFDNAASEITQALSAVGELLEHEREQVVVVVLGGAALNLLRIVDRSTRDVDIVALAQLRDGGTPGELIPPTPLPESLERAIHRVARDFRLPENWMNTGPASQWETGLPTGLAQRIHWRRFGGLTVGLVDRYDLIFFKLYASADSVDSSSVHFQDLMALQPTDDELRAAEEWVRGQDPSEGFATSLEKVLDHARRTSNASGRGSA